MSETRLAVVVAKCVRCGHEREIAPGQTQPMCEKCYMPMIAKEARVSR